MTWTLDPDLPGANACGAAIAHHDGSPALSIAADPRHGSEALWFHCRLRRLAGDAPAPWLILRGVGELLGGGDGSALQPVARRDRGAWERLPRGTPLHHDDGRIDVCWRLPVAAASIEVAFCLPYGDHELDCLLGEAGGRLRVDAIGSSEGSRPLLRLANASGTPGSQRPGLYLLARQHAGETPGSWVLDGLLRRLAELGETAPLTWAVPFVDTDGVAEGAYGKDRHPVDYNRSWWQMARRHEVHCIKHDIARWRERCVPRLCIDFHAPGGCERDGCYTFTAIGGNTPPAESVTWTKRLAAALGDDYAGRDFARVANYPSRWPSDSHPSFTTWARGQGLPVVSLETSYQGLGETAWNEADYRAIGTRIADAVALAEA